jgi:superoxide dismutase, Fe-Mn family
MQTAVARQLPGWIWLCVNDHEKVLRIVVTNNEDNPMMYGILAAQCRPILGIDMWEHAYYDQHNGDKEAYIKAFFASVNWDKVSTIYEKLSATGFKSLPSPLEML